ncbi:MAG: glycogen/starch synthase [Vampirovibrionales bacterium]|nr:glycogen/starch synthase [Vampirovibrionales bacterium]
MPMNIVLCAAEVVPFAKVGGLADVMGSLPKALAEIELTPTIVMPRYGLIDPEKWNLVKTEYAYGVELDDKAYNIEVLKGALPGTEVPVYFIENTEMFGRDSVYPYGQAELEINSFRLLGKALFGLLERLNLFPEILHLHDWHTAPIALELNEKRKNDPRYASVRSVFTIHNLAYQGVYGDTNWLREGLSNADALTTVSPTYAREIQTAEFGEGLESLLQKRSKDLHGILNGIDMALLNPKTDHFIPAHYDATHFAAGKATCKEALQKELGLPLEPETPLFGFVSRLVDQKGLDIMMPAIHQLIEKLGGSEKSQKSFQFAILGSGEPRYEEQLKEINAQYPHIRTFIGFNLAMAQKIYSGSDFFIMPSAFEPCGLGQMIALRYGSIPVVRSVGGLADTVFDVREKKDGNGFCFKDYTAEAFCDTMLAAIDYYKKQSEFSSLVTRALSEDFGWQKSAKTYQELYQSLSKKAPVSV